MKEIDMVMETWRLVSGSVLIFPTQHSPEFYIILFDQNISTNDVDIMVPKPRAFHRKTHGAG